MAATDETQLHARGLALTRAVSTQTLVMSFEHTDELMDQGVTIEQHHELVIARGWIMDVLEERGQLALIGCE